MITFLRDGAKSGIMKFFLIGFMGLAVMGLVFIDMTGSFRDGVSSNSVARVGDTEISTRQMMTSLQNAERQSGMMEIPAELRLRMALQSVDNEVRRRVLLLEAQEMGLMVPDSYAAREIKNQLQPLVESGFTPEEALAQQLRNTGMSENQLIQAFKQDLAVQLLVSAITSGRYAPDEMVQTAYSYENQRRSGAVIALRPENFPTTSQAVDEETLRTYYRNNSDKYMTPEYREISYFVFDDESLPDAAEISEEELRSIYEDNIENYPQPASRITNQAVFQSADLAQEAVANMETAEDFDRALAGLSSSDYLTLRDEPVNEGDLVEELVDAAYNTPIGEINGPIETSLGWVVMAVTGEQEETVQPFEDVQSEVRSNISSERNDSRFYDAVNELDDMLAGGMSLSDIAEEYNLTVYQTPMLEQDGTLQSGKSAEILQNDYAGRLLEEAFEMRADETHPLMETDNGEFIGYIVSNIQPSATRPFDTIRAQVTVDYNRDTLDERMQAAADEIVTALNDGALATDIAKENGYKLTTIPLMKGEEALENENLREAVVQNLFDIDQSNTARKITAEGQGYDVVLLGNIAFPDGSTIDPDLRSDYVSTIGDQLKNDMLNQYEAALREKYDVEISRNAIERALQPVDVE